MIFFKKLFIFKLNRVQRLFLASQIKTIPSYWIKLKKYVSIFFYLHSNWDGYYREYEGVINLRNDGDSGNIGIIKIDSDGSIELLKDFKGDYLYGAYLIYFE